ncbi:TPA: aminotransferase class I/II-fold pyridoxal phosphate-dependent enzyme [Clostridium perfringens]|uniref:DegT/DnrJ/EryC1/StrS family aminotransferase n=1 Tax=Clostridium perfringens TaxID=1502 RepID=UPI001A23B3D5|nr:aminotransferase class I/II-fold pyridoxal phosphate-dependent enzyme [Clostridium perfringens]UBK75101.1 aminotransferase class I/II-fold pyridoxal phosphate-dependent enzyme [Clostridium perfringens]HAT4143100.1 aminotransferase class I/II-fold pyridoxal phosphate-dependent enzyme [Clostridium perfringens]HAT4146232.1 aminotransferase class I/II-fold pyridoxal phosphate-dependent enzyme [Clostridium perfringens]
MGGLEEVFVKEAFDTNWIAPLGVNVDGFEKELSEYVGSKTGAALASGTAAIHMALKVIGVEKGDKVFCSSLTFAASCNPIIYEGGIPVFIDSEPESHNMSPVALEKAFKAYEEKGEMPKAVIVVNLYGQSADMDKIMEICKKYNVPIIEDAAESLGATYKGKHSGTFGEYGVYSFNGNKIITTSGGGMLVSNNEEGIAKVRFWSTQARDKARHYEHTELGYNYRMSNIVAGIGRGQLRVLEDRIAKKKEIFETYKEAFKDIEDIEMMPVCEYGEPNYWLTTITLNENSKVKPLDIILALEKENIESRPIWKPMHIQPYYKEYDFYSHNDEDEVSVSEDIFNRGVCLPSDTKMSDHDMVRVIGIIKKLFQKEINEIGCKKEVLV